MHPVNNEYNRRDALTCVQSVGVVRIITINLHFVQQPNEKNAVGEKVLIKRLPAFMLTVKCKLMSTLVQLYYIVREITSYLSFALWTCSDNRNFKGRKQLSGWVF